MSGRLPVFVNPLVYAKRGMSVSGELSTAEMERIQELLVEPYTVLAVEMVFDCEGERNFLRGRVTGDINIECQRCMQPMQIAVDHEIRLGLIQGEAEIPQLREGEEPLIVEDDEIRLQDIVEDELLLLLPMVAMHEVGKCQMDFRQEKGEEPEQKADKPNPFASLANLKNESD